TTSNISTLSLHDALPIYTTPIKPIIDVTNWGNYNGINSKPGFISKGRLNPEYVHEENVINIEGIAEELSIIEVFINGIKVKEVKDRKSTRLNSSHVKISY